MEEWLGGSLNTLTPKELLDLNIELNNDYISCNYRIGFIEAYSIKNYPETGSTSGIPDRDIWRNVDLVINSNQCEWMKIGEIKNLRGLSDKEAQIIFSYFSRKLTPSGLSIISSMQADIDIAIAFGSTFFPWSKRPILRLLKATDIFSCIFPVTGLEIFDKERFTHSSVIPKRYRWRY